MRDLKKDGIENSESIYSDLAKNQRTLERTIKIHEVNQCTIEVGLLFFRVIFNTCRK